MTPELLEPEIGRTLIFVRHGQYTHDPERLTELGLEQARLTAEALQEWNIDRIVSSTMPRAKETAGIIAKRLGLQPQANPLLCEARLPAPPFYFKGDWIKDKRPASIATLKKKMQINKNRADRAFDMMFKKPARGQSRHLIVAHGNVTAYWVCRALKIEPKNWVNLQIQQCSITTLSIDRQGRIKLMGFSDVGHIPFKKRTYL